MHFPDVTEWGWIVEDNKLSIKWDSDENIKRVEKYRKLWTSGCNCRSSSNPCSNRTCGCRKSGKTCGPCKCCGKCENKPENPSINALMEEVSSEIGNPLSDVDNDCLTDDEPCDIISSDDFE